MNVVILQPSYIPWRGYFHQIAKADLFIFYDDVQYDKRGWRNRNRIKTPRGPLWLSIPVYNQGVQTYHTPINEIRIVWEQDWNQAHWRSIQQAYKKAPFFEEYAAGLEKTYQSRPDRLVEFTIPLTAQLAGMLGIRHTRFLRSSEIPGIQGAKTDRLINILQAVGATHYISGPSARDYIEEEKFHRADISLEYMTYNYAEYAQLYPPYEPQVSILDLLFMEGPEAMTFIDPGRVGANPGENQT